MKIFNTIFVKYWVGSTLPEASVITIKVPKELKRKMNELDVNWSDYIRKSIATKIEEVEIRRASEKLDAIRLRSKSVSTEELVSWTREDRGKIH